MRWLLLVYFIGLTNAQFDNIYTIASSWSMWSAWSACAPEGVMIRVRACSTVRGFKCVGRNKEFKSCELHLNGEEDFDEAGEDRNMALKQLYQDYDLHGDVASMPKGPRFVPKQPQRSEHYLPPGNDVTIVGPPGTRNPVVNREETKFMGSFKSAEEREEETSTVPARTSALPIVPSSFSSPVNPMDVEEELMEEDDSGWAVPSSGLPTVPTTIVPQVPETLATIAPRRRYKTKYVTQEPITTTTSTTERPAPTTDELEEEVEMSEEEARSLENGGSDLVITAATMEPVQEEEDEQHPETVHPQSRPTTTEEPTTTTEATTTTEEPTTPTTKATTEETPASFNIPKEEVAVEAPVKVQPLYRDKFMKIQGRTVLQQLPTVIGVGPQSPPLGMLPPVAPPRARIHHSGGFDLEEEKQVLKARRRRVKKLRNKKKKGPSYPEDEYVTGDTALALNWLIANMTNSMGEESLPVSDKVILEKFIPKEVMADFKWSQWSLWSECRCALQRRKRICLPTSSELIQENSKCPMPEYEERSCNSKSC